MTQNSINNEASSLDVDSLHLDGNTISTTVTNDSLILSPNGTGAVSLNTNFVSQSKSETGVTMKHRIDNTDSTAAAGSSANMEARARPEPDGMAYFTTTITANRSYSWGVDDVDKKMKINTNIGNSNVQTGTNLWTMTPAGERTMPLQPAFLVYLSSDLVDFVGNSSSSKTIVFDTKVFDQNLDYNTGTGAFVAPITGRYQLSYNVRMKDITAAMSRLSTRFAASNRTIISSEINIGAVRTADPNFPNFVSVGHSILLDMNAADSCFIQVSVDGGAAATVDIVSGSTIGSFFSGSLIC